MAPATDPTTTGSPSYPARILLPRDRREIVEEFQRTHCDPEGIGIMAGKARSILVRIDEVPLKASPLLKQEFLAVGGDAVHARGVADHSVSTSSVILIGTRAQYLRALAKLDRQPFHLTAIGRSVEAALSRFEHRGPRTIRGAHCSWIVGDRPQVLGIVNVTPDSFSDGGRYLDPERAIAHGVALVQEGAAALDIGGESTRPGARPVDPAEEWRRIAPVIRGLRDRVSVPLSVDTRHAEVARRAIDAGADLINDVEGLRDREMRAAIREGGAAAIVMHMRGTPETMQHMTEYADLRAEVFHALADATERARSEGIGADRLLVDPGLGFGKSPAQSLELLLHVGELASLGYPIVVGASRKSFLGWAVGQPDPTLRFEAGLAAAVLAADAGAEILRVHDVAPTVRALALVARGRSDHGGDDRSEPSSGRSSSTMNEPT
jgi:dihydropteroate synthase